MKANVLLALFVAVVAVSPALADGFVCGQNQLRTDPVGRDTTDIYGHNSVTVACNKGYKVTIAGRGQGIFGSLLSGFRVNCPLALVPTGTFRGVKVDLALGVGGSVGVYKHVTTGELCFLTGVNFCSAGCSITDSTLVIQNARLKHK